MVKIDRARIITIATLKEEKTGYEKILKLKMFQSLRRKRWINRVILKGAFINAVIKFWKRK